MPASPERRFRAPWPLFWAAFSLRVACILIGHTYRIRTGDNHFGFGWEMGRIAQSLVLGHGYANPFNGISGPTAWAPPLYPLLMALSFKLFGLYTNAAACFLLICNSLFSAAMAPAIYEIAARCFDAYGFARRSSRDAEPVALWSAWLWAVYPAALQYAVHWIWEMSLSAVLFTWALVLALRLRRIGELAQVRTFFDSDMAYSHEPAPEKPAGMGTWAVFGLLWGLLALSNASLLLCMPAVILWILWPGVRAPRTLAKPIAGAALSCIVFAAALMPWIVRNERVLHAFIPTRSNLGIELYTSMKAETGPLPWGTTLPLWPGDPEFRQYVQMGEVSFAKMRSQQAKEMLHVMPGRFWGRSLNRFLFYWDSTPHPEGKPFSEFIRTLNFAFLSVAGLLGLGLAVRNRVPGVGLFTLMFLLAPLPYYLLTVQSRFRHPIEPLITILAVYLFRSTEPRRKATA